MSSTTCPKMTFFCGACRPVSAAYDEEVHLCPSSVCRGRCPHRPAGGGWRPPLRCRTFPLFGAPPKPGGGSELCRLRRTRPVSVALSPSGPPCEPSEAVRVGKRSRGGRSELCRLRGSEGSGACGDAVTLRVGRMAGLLSGHSAKNAAGLRPACFFASMSS